MRTIMMANHAKYIISGMRKRFTGRGGRHADDDGPVSYRKEGDRWIKLKVFELLT